MLVAALAGPGLHAEVRWRDGSVGPSTPMSAGALVSRLAVLKGRESARRIVVQLDGPVDVDSREQLETNGITLLDPLGGNAWFASLSPGLDPVRAVGSLPQLRRVEAIATDHKLHPDLAAGIVRPWSVVPGDGPRGDDKNETTVAVYVWFHRDFDVAGQAGPLLARHGAKLRTRLESIPAVVAHLPFEAIPQLAAEDGVMWVEPPMPPFAELNDDSRARTGAEILQQAPFGLDGSGVNVLVYDGGQVYAHDDLAGRLTIGPSDTEDVSPHASHVAGTIAGDGSASAGTYRGMAPAAEIYSYSFEQAFVYAGLQEGFLYTDPGDLERDYAEAIDLFDIDVTNNSIGTNTAPNGYPCEWEGDYGATSALIDEIARGSLGSRPVVVWANGNERGNGRCGTDYVTTAPPACAKNPIHVGALNSDDDSMTDFTSWGPCDDGRLKPIVSGPGCQTTDDLGVTSIGSYPGYSTACGTSMASPAVAGISALLVQQHRASFPALPDPDNATLKAILANSAADVETPGPDYKTGFGSVRGVAAVETIQQGRFITGEVGQGEVLRYLVSIPAPVPELKVTLAWDDPAGTPNVNPALVNDLDLRVVDLSSASHLPWTLDPGNPAAPAVRTQRDGLNNIEQVVVDPPGGAVALYYVEVEGFDIALGSTQRFSLAANAAIFDCHWAGRVDASRYVTCETTLPISVSDCDLDTNSSMIEQIPVEVWSTTDDTAEEVALTETAISSPVFEGSVPLSEFDGPGVVQVHDGDTVHVVYVDEDNGTGQVNVPVFRDVTVDCRPPGIQGAGAVYVDRHEAIIRVVLSDPGGVTIHYGTSCGALDLRSADPRPTTVKHMTLTALDIATTYFFAVEVGDEAGNTNYSDNNGECYSFTTADLPVFVFEEIDGVFNVDVDGSSFILTPDGSPGYYGVCRAGLGADLPVDDGPSEILFNVETVYGSTSASPVDIPTGKTIQHFGQAYSNAWLSPHGYVKYADDEYVSSTANIGHFFENPMVSLIWERPDLDSLGIVEALALPDRMVYTWDDVTFYDRPTPSRIQLETLFDGAIRMSYLALDTEDVWLGVSDGQGVDPDVTQIDFSAAPPCDACTDDDADGFLDCRELCDPAGAVCGDCDDGNFEVSPVALDSCNHVDDDCDGLVDELFGLPPVTRDLLDPQAGDPARAGIAVEQHADVDGDGYPEILVGAPDDDTVAAAGAGSAMLLSGATGTLICKGIDPLGDSDDDLGRSVASMRDLTGDGVPDFAAGNPRDDDVALNAGAVLVFSGADCSLVYRATSPLSRQGDYTGYSIDTMADLTGDGVQEILAGAPFAHRASDDHVVGAVLVFSGADGAYVDRNQDIESLSLGAQLGYSVAGSTRNMGGDPAPDFFAGAPFHDTAGANDVGIVYQFNGSTLDEWSSTPGSSAGELMGLSIAILDDEDYDSWPSVAYGAPGANNGRGMIRLKDINGSPVFYGDPLSQEFDNFGWSIARYRDLDGDNVDEILVGAPFNDAAGTSAGRVVILDGATGFVVQRIEDPGIADGGQLGFAVGRIGDLSGDGRDEILAGAPFFHGGGAVAAGKAVAVSLEADCDGDGSSPFAGDCDDTDANLQSLPGEVPGVGFLEPTIMTWNSPPAGGAVSLTYELLRSTDAADVSGTVCVESGFSGTARLVFDSPATAGTAHYYLLRAVNACGKGPLGVAGDGTPRTVPDVCP